MFGGGGGLFGAPKLAASTGGLFGTAPSGGLFGQQSQLAQQQQPQASLFGGGNSLGFGAGLSTASSQPTQQVMYAGAGDFDAYGANPLFANSTSSVVTPEPKKKPPIFTAFRGTPINRSSTKITRLRGFGASTSSASPASANGSALTFSTSSSSGGGVPGLPGTPNRGSPLRLVNGLGDEAALSPNAFVSRPSVKKLVIDRKALSTNSPDSNGPPKSASASSAGRKVTFNRDLDFQSRASTSFPGRDDEGDSYQTGGGDSTPVRRSGGSSSNLCDDSLASATAAASLKDTDWTRQGSPAPSTSAPAPTISRPLKRGDYSTEPSIDVLQKLPEDKLRGVSNLIVKRKGFGQVAFQDPVDLTTLESVEDLLGGVVDIGDRFASVYGDDQDKPAPGLGLNVRAKITLEECWPMDKATREPNRRPDPAKVSAHRKRLARIPGTTDSEFNEVDGTWTFTVPFF